MINKTKIGLIGMVTDEMKENFWGTCQKLAEIGYKGIESTRQLLKGDINENLRKLSKIGLEPVAYSTNKEEIMEDIDQVIENAKKLEVPHVAIWWGPAESREQLIEDANIYNEAGAKIADANMKLCYHNHEHEFNTFFDGICAMDILAEYTDPDKVYFELDCGWITFGGADPVYILKKMAGRVPAIHIKDLKSTEYSDRSSVVFSAVGTGVVKSFETVKTAIETGVDWVVVEQDRMRNLTNMETVKVSYLNLKEAGLAQ